MFDGDVIKSFDFSEMRLLYGQDTAGPRLIYGRSPADPLAKRKALDGGPG
jgi:hypothetical protein